MLILLFSLFQIIYSKQGKRIFTHESYNHPIDFQTQTLKFGTNQQTITRLPIDSIYDVDIYDGEDLIPSPILTLDKEYVDDSDIDNKCVALPKHPKIQEVFNFQFSQERYCTDVLAKREYNSIFTVSDAYEMQKYQILEKNGTWELSEPFESIKLNEKFPWEVEGDAYFSCLNSSTACFVITNFAGFGFDYSEGFSKRFAVYQELAFKQRKIVHKVYTYESDLAVAIGNEGVDIYSYQQVHNDQTNLYNKIVVTHKFTLDPQDFDQPEINIINVKLDWGRLSVLDQYSGLYIFDFKKNIKPLLLLHIKISRCITFEQYQDTYLVAAKTVNNVEYLMEIFVNLYFDWYYVNRVFLDDFVYNDIQISKDYAIIIGEDTHLVMRHSIFNGFVPKTRELIKVFEQQDLIRFELFYQIIDQNDYKFSNQMLFVGVGTHELFIWKMTDYNPVVICNFNKNKQINYTVKFNATLCSPTLYPDLYEQCAGQFRLSIQSLGTIIESNMLTTLIIIGSAVGFVLVIFFVFCVLKKRQFIRVIKELKAKINDRQYGQFQEVEQHSIIQQASQP